MHLSNELIYLGVSVVLLFVHTFLQGGLSTAELGLAYNASPRDEGLQPKGVLAGRAARAASNYRETYPAFIALALALAVSGHTGGLGAWGAGLWFWARVVYLPLYLSGVPYIRTLAWAVAGLGLLFMLIRLFQGG